MNNNNYTIILDTYNSLIFTDEEYIYIISKNKTGSIKILNEFCDTAPDLEDTLKMVLEETELPQEEIKQEIEELKETELYKFALEFYKDL